MKIHWTPAQQKVIDSRGKNVLVSAAAGSGKTAVLTERILELLKEGEDLKRFLVFTFTRASASDMKEKLRKKLTHEVLEGSSPHLKRQLRDLTSSDISTIHSFCHRLCREYFFELDIDPAYEIGSQHQLDTMDQEVLDVLFEEEYQKREPEFLELSTIFSGARGDEGFKKILITLRQYFDMKVDREKSVEFLLARHKDSSFWMSAMEAYIHETRSQMLACLQEAREYSRVEKMSVFLEEERKSVIRWDGFKAINWQRFPFSKEIKENEIHREEIQKLRNKAKELSSGFNKIFGSWESFDDLFEEHLALFPRMKKLFSMTMEFSHRSFEARRERAMVSFSDLERLSIELLKNEAIRESIREKYRYVFIDEYQDTSELQEELIRSVSREDNCFMVGDIKQSIYRFREARPEIFLEKYHRYEAKEEGSERIDLSVNFRSAPPIITAINAIFEHIMRRDFGGIDYDEAARLRFGNTSLQDHEAPIEVMLTPEGEMSKIEEELHSIADKVMELKEEGFSYGDIVVLLRAPSAYVSHAPRIFREKGVPLFLDSVMAYLSTLEVETLLAGLRLIDNAHLDIPLLAILRLPLVGFSEQELYDIKKAYPDKKTFHEAFWAPWESEKKEIFLSLLETLRRKSRFLSLDALLREIYRSLALEEFILALEHPAQRLSNIRLLYFYARSFEETGGMGISGYLRYLEHLEALKSDYAAPRGRGEDRELVRMMSIHRAKGLEFPVVIVGGLDRAYYEPEGASFVVTSDEGVLMDFFDVATLRKKSHGFKRFLSEYARSASRQEEIRLLYVAMSRAQHRLVLSACVKGEKELSVLQKDALEKTLPETVRPIDLILRSLEIAENEIITPGFVISPPPERSLETPAPLALTASGKIPEPFVLERRLQKSKYSVSELTKWEDVMPEPLLPLDPGELTARERGTLFHKALQWIDFERLKRLDDLDEQLLELKERGILVGFEEKGLLERFLHSAQGRLLIEKAPFLKKEVPFTFFKEWQGEEILVQGVIDLLILEEECTIIDYKTDRSLAYAGQYLEQVGIYQEAVEQILGRRVKEALVVFVRFDHVIRKE